MLAHQAYRFELDPNNAQRSGLASHAGASRFAYNWGLALLEEHVAAHKALVALALRQGAGAKEAEAWATEVTGPVPWSLPALRRQWNRQKHEVAPLSRIAEIPHCRSPKFPSCSRSIGGVG